MGGNEQEELARYMLSCLMADLLWLVRLPKRALKHAAWWLIWNTRLGKFGPFVTSIALWRRDKKMELHPDPFAAYDTDSVIVSGTKNYDGMWVKCRHCKGGFPVFVDYEGFKELVVYTLDHVPGRETTCQIVVECPNCRKKNHYWFYEQAIKDLYGDSERDKGETRGPTETES